MKIAVLNYPGKVGKTTLVANMLAPNMPEAEVLAIESVNETAEALGMDVTKIHGDKFRKLFQKLIMLDDAIVDVGSSNVESFLDGMMEFSNVTEDLDFFVVPVVPKSMEQKETMNMIKTLTECGIEPSKIRVVFNQVDVDVSEEFAPILNFARREKLCVANPEAAVFESELFDMLALEGMSIDDVRPDGTDYKAKAREVGKDGDKRQRERFIAMHVMQGLRVRVKQNMDHVFNILFN